jgi:hypothetical protein
MPDGLIAHFWYIVFVGCGFTLLGFVTGFSLGEQNARHNSRYSKGNEE